MNAKKGEAKASPFKLSKSLAEFAAEAANKIQIVFGRGMYVDENTSQAASVEFVAKGEQIMRAADCK